MESTFSDDTIKFIEFDVKNLVRDLTNFEEQDENFRRCVDFTMYHILCEKHSIPSQTFTSEKLDTFATRYDYEGFSYYAENLKTAVETYLNSDSTITGNKEVKWRILELFILLSRDTFKSDVLLSLERRFQLCSDITLPDEFNKFTEEEKIDWNKYLQEGSEKFRLLLNGSEGSDHDSDIFDDAENTPSVVDDKTIKPEYNDVFGHFPQVHQVVLDEDTKFKKTLSEAIESKTWFLNNQQHSWWNDKEFALLPALHPAAVFGLTWDKICNEMCIQENPTSHQYLEEYKIIRELLWIIIAEDGSVQKRIQSLRSQVSVPSVIQKTFSSIIDNFIAVAKKYHEMILYCNQVLCPDNLQMPFTFQAYASVLKDFCHLFLQQVIKEENVIRMQCSTYTLLLLQDNLDPHLNVINFLYKLHKDCISSRWCEEPPWLCIVKLLTVLFSKLQNVKSAIHLKILLMFFFRSFEVYANIIDTWLTEGELYDWKNEFFMKKEAANNKYTILFDADLQIAPFFHRMSEKLLTCSQNVEFLTKLNKIHSIQEETAKEGKFFNVLVEEFVKRLHQVKSPQTRNDYSNLTKSDWNGLKQSQNYCGESLNIAYLIQAFSDQLGIGVHEDNTLPKNNDIFSKDWEQNLDNLELLPVAHALEQALYVLIDRREFVIANLFKSAIIGHYQFFNHVQNLSKMLLMDLHLFCNRIVTRLEKRHWEGNHLIIVFLYDCIEVNKLWLGELFHFTVVKKDLYADDVTMSVSEIIKIVDCISLQYTVQWPMNLIFSSSVIDGFYCPLLKLILKINIAFYGVSRLYFSDLPHMRLWMRKLRRLEVFRHWVVLLLQRLRTYLMLTMSQSLDWKLIRDSIKMETISSLQAYYSSYLEKVKQKCLIDLYMLEYLNRALDRIWRVCDDIRDLWTKAAKLQLDDDNIFQSVQLYIEGLWYFVQIMQKIVKEKRTDDALHELVADLKRMVKSYRLSIPEHSSLRRCQ